MISPFLPSHDADSVALDFGVFIAEHARTFRTSQTAIIAALRPIITETSIPVSTPSQPFSHAAAAQTDGGQGVLPSSPPVDHTAPLHFSDQPDGAENEVEAQRAHGDAAFRDPLDIEDEDGAQPAPMGKPARGRPDTTRAKIAACHAANPSWPSKLIAQHLNISEDAVRATASRKKLKLVSWWDYQRAQAAETAAALRVAIQPETPPAVISEPAIEAPEPPAKPPTLAQRIRDHLAVHPDATLREVADALDAKMQSVGWAAQKAGILLRKRNAQERSEASAKGAQGRAKPSDPIEAPDETSIRPDETVMSAPQALRQYLPAPPTTARFYLRESDGEKRFVHQSLAPCPTGPGPLMTLDRKWAWYDNIVRYRGAKKLWPELATMRKEAAQP